MAVQDLPFRPVCGGGPVGVQHEIPSPPVNANVVMELAQEHAIGDGRDAAVGLVAQVVHIAGGRPLPAARPFAVSGAKGDGAPDMAGDLAGEADVEDDGASVL